MITSPLFQLNCGLIQKIISLCFFFLLLICGTYKRATMDRSVVSFATKQVAKHCWGTRTVINT